VEAPKVEEKKEVAKKEPVQKKKEPKKEKKEKTAEELELEEELRRVEAEDALAKRAAANVAEAAAAGKPHVNVVFIGHVDHGKSTLSGAILLACGMIDKRDIQKLQSDAENEGRESWWKAFLMDTNPEERSKGKTQETARSHFQTEEKMYTILDAPGHKVEKEKKCFFFCFCFCFNHLIF
jgi:peptide chain release factor subunit 3